jgi:hypothetical protein
MKTTWHEWREVRRHPDTAWEDFGAELAEAAYPIALRHGLGEKWLDLELDLWKVMTATAQKWDREALLSPSIGK